MKMKSYVMAALLITGFAAGTFTIRADDKAKAYPLKTCVVSDEEIGKDPDMQPHVFTYKGQEVKLCCKSCLKDFNKNPEKFMKKIADAQKK